MDNLEYLLEPNFQVMDDNGKPLVGGWIEVYLHNTTTKVITYCDFDGTQNEFKVVLNSLGMANIIVEADNLYDVYCYDSFGALRWSRMNVSKVDLFPLKVYTEGDLENPVAEYDPTDGQGEGFVQKKLTIKVNGQTEAEYVPFAEEGEEVDIHSESVEWDAGSHSIKKDVNGTKETIVEVENTYSPTSEKPISGKGVADGKFVSVNSQSWSDAQKEQARDNIDAVGASGYIPRGAGQGPLEFSILFDGNSSRITFSGKNVSSTRCYLMPVGGTKGQIVLYGTDGIKLDKILKVCTTNNDVLLTLEDGNIPIFQYGQDKYIPFLYDGIGEMHLPPVFRVYDVNPFTGDALGKSVERKIYNNGLVESCLWGKPYGLNQFELGEYSCNSDYGLNLASEMRMVWRRVPCDRDILISSIALIGGDSSINKNLMNGIFEIDGNNVTKVSDATTWTTIGTTSFKDPANVLKLQQMESYFGDYIIAKFSFTPLQLEAGKNYLFPARFNSYSNGGDPYIYTYKNAYPAMPWEELVCATTENGDPDLSTSVSGCKPSALRIYDAESENYIWI